MQVYRDLVLKFPLVAIEDPFGENDFDAFSNMLKDSKEWELNQEKRFNYHC